MNNEAWMWIVIMAFLSGLGIGVMVQGNSWATDCDYVGGHVWGKTAYDCKERK